MSIHDRVEAWIADVEGLIFPQLDATPQFKNPEKLFAQFSKAVTSWRKGGSVRQVEEYANELAAAVALAQFYGCAVGVQYEPSLNRTAKTIDFRLDWPDGTRSWVDMKTVAPQWIDDCKSWKRFEKFSASMPYNARLIANRDYAGAALSGQEIKARWSFVKRAIEVEKKAALLDASEIGPVRLLFCSNGAFHKDALEDFADFYRSGSFREDDWSRNALARYLEDEQIAFTRELAGFHFLERPWDEVFASALVTDIRGPDFGR